MMEAPPEEGRMSEGPRVSCPHKPSCAMFALFNMAGTLRIWQDNYCDAEFERCERYKRSERGERVARELMPNGKMLTLNKR